MEAPEQIGAEAPAGLECDARYGRVLGIVLGNLLLTVLTLGIYSFWGRVRVRRYLWATTRFAGEPLEYTGTGAELLRGALIVLVLVFLPLLALQLTIDQLVGARWAGRTQPGQAVVALILVYLAAVGAWRAMRYRLRRTLWSGLSSTMVGGGWRYGLISSLSLVHVVATLGLSKPARDVAIARRYYPTMRLAGARLVLDKSFQPPWRRWMVCWLLALPTLGISVAFYQVELYRRLAQALSWAGVRAHFDATPGRYLRLVLGNWLLIILSLGLLGALAAARAWRFWCRHLHCTSALDHRALAAATGAREPAAEGLASMLDVDAI